MDEEIISKLKKLSNEAEKYFAFDKVVLYGSYSNGTYKVDSDIDVAFFVKEINENHWQLSARLFELADKIDYRIEPVIIKAATDKSGFANHILENGIVIN